MRKSFLTVAVLICSAALLLTACGGYAGSNSNGVKTRAYSDDGYLGRTNSYPKIPGQNMANTYENDARMISEAIKNVPGVASSSVNFNGADAHVTIQLSSDVAPNEVATVEREAAVVLRFNFPRYAIHVNALK